MKNTLITILILFSLCTSGCLSTKQTITQNTQSADNQGFYGTEIFLHEFEIIKRVLSILEKAIQSLENDQPVSQETLQRIVEVISNFSDKQHQEKADRILFPLLRDKEEGRRKYFLGRLLMQHVTLRDKIRNLSESLNTFYQGKRARKRIARIANSYIRYTRRHLGIEERILLSWANSVLTYEDQIMLKNKFETLKKHDIETGIYEKYAIMIEGLEKELGIRPEY
ncbi:MAG: hemerythrin domain-containing protein [Candidatus Loosdrechtia sp.]|uniref:hemerythrin domain-containing protein n=1 Tax=Candidatus Loosdrechtia sp. TaxID=3101272 RepID=UPI003A6DAAB4|nr:MAG: hemerythrin domain-containing protein [Candidatus Jettenia sp. AMX2]